jgi:hypothetical protein
LEFPKTLRNLKEPSNLEECQAICDLITGKCFRDYLYQVAESAYQFKLKSPRLLGRQYSIACTKIDFYLDGKDQGFIRLSDTIGIMRCSSDPSYLLSIFTNTGNVLTSYNNQPVYYGGYQIDEERNPLRYGQGIEFRDNGRLEGNFLYGKFQEGDYYLNSRSCDCNGPIMRKKNGGVLEFCHEGVFYEESAYIEKWKESKLCSLKFGHMQTFVTERFFDIIGIKTKSPLERWFCSMKCFNDTLNLPHTEYDNVKFRSPSNKTTKCAAL